MFTNIEQADFGEAIVHPQFRGHPEDREFSTSLRLAHYCALEEAVGAVFGLMSLWYVVCSIIRLA